MWGRTVGTAFLPAQPRAQQLLGPVAGAGGDAILQQEVIQVQV